VGAEALSEMISLLFHGKLFSSRACFGFLRLAFVSLGNAFFPQLVVANKFIGRHCRASELPRKLHAQPLNFVEPS